MLMGWYEIKMCVNKLDYVRLGSQTSLVSLGLAKGFRLKTQIATVVGMEP